jgi:hypothetical protein
MSKARANLIHPTQSQASGKKSSAYAGLHRSWYLDLLAQPLSHSIDEFLGAQVRLPCYPSNNNEAKNNVMFV